MSSIRGLLALVYIILLNAPAVRAEIVTLKLPSPPDVTTSELHYDNTCPADAAVILLCPGMNGDARTLVSEGPWRNFAASHRLGLAGISFSSAPELLYGKPARGYYYPDQGSGPALLEGLRKVYGPDKKLLLYGFSGGAQFGSRFSEMYPDKLLAWAVYSSSFWPAPVSASSTSAPGLVACGENDAERFGPSFSYFQKGRKRGGRWTWVSIGNTGHVRHRRFEEFLRSYFAVIIKADFRDETWLDAETKTAMGEDDQLLAPSLAVWLPNREIATAWKAIHTP